jgi:hypothetical protein
MDLNIGQNLPGILNGPKKFENIIDTSD